MKPSPRSDSGGAEREKQCPQPARLRPTPLHTHPPLLPRRQPPRWGGGGMRGEGTAPRGRQRAAGRRSHVGPSGWGAGAVRGAALGGAGGPWAIPHNCQGLVRDSRQGFPYASVPLRPPLGPPSRRPPSQPKKTRRGCLVPPYPPPGRCHQPALPHQPQNLEGNLSRDRSPTVLI